MIELSIPVPPAPILERALGYEGEARWIAAWWEPCGDMALVSDGSICRTGFWEGYLTYVRHCYQLQRFLLGSSDEQALECLVFDRVRRRAYIAPYQATLKLLQDQWPKREPMRLTEEEWNTLMEETKKHMARLRGPSAEDIERVMQEKASALAGLRAWLNQN